MKEVSCRFRRFAYPYLVALAMVNLCFYKYATIHSLFHSSSSSDVRFNIYGDPQIEGDAKLHRQPWAGRFDLMVNDYYLHHIYKSTIDAFSPHYVVTMGDIFSSQWVSKDEYYRRIHRFKWISNRIDSRNATIKGNHIYFYLAGNHDIGYGGETRPYHISRYLRNFGLLNQDWIIDLDAGKNSDRQGLHRVATLNAMNLDATRIDEYRRETWKYVRHLAAERAETPEIPLLLFLHIPLTKPAGVCEPRPTTSFKDGFVAYQDYLSPATSAFILHCLKPTIIFNGHDHNGCLAMHSVDESTDLPIHMGGLNKYLQSGEDLCQLSLEELDTYSSEVSTFAQNTMSVVNGSVATTNSSWTAIEVTVRSAMGDYGGVTGIFDIGRSGSIQQESSSKARDVRREKILHVVNRREVTASANGYTYQYREVALGHHLVVRIVVIINLASMLALPLVWLLS
ncbi:hypothetical protein LPJ57_008092 [Coemansia sp. RSA 486]|nr:hypothetical protein LPJ57_008092 [Coemansia sp. RSA 486]